jgi:hypothetical protein
VGVDLSLSFPKMTIQFLDDLQKKTASSRGIKPFLFRFNKCFILHVAIMDKALVKNEKELQV